MDTVVIPQKQEAEFLLDVFQTKAKHGNMSFTLIMSQTSWRSSGTSLPEINRRNSDENEVSAAFLGALSATFATID